LIAFAMGAATLVAASSALAAGASRSEAAPAAALVAASAQAREAAVLRGRTANLREGNPLALRPLYVEPYGPARSQAKAWKGSRPDDAALIARIAEQPQALWLGDWLRDVRGTAAARVRAARRAGSVPILVAYNIPHRDCGQHSSGGAASASAYRAWIAQLARAIGDAPAAVVLEPDGLAGIDCLSRSDRAERIALIRDAVMRLSGLPQTAVYIDAGNASWIQAGRMARRLKAAGIAHARGFALNVSGFEPTARAAAFGHAVSARAGGARFVIDTSRNGAGAAGAGEWCNPSGRAIGELPSTSTGDPLLDAYLWVKRPGESDGACNDGPPAGVWWPEYALGLVQRAASTA